jgi:hypothetical protein
MKAFLNKLTHTKSRASNAIAIDIDTESLSMTKAGNVYSFGVILCELLQQQLYLHDGSHQHSTFVLNEMQLDMIVQGHVPVLDMLIPSKLIHLAQQCLQPHPEKRPSFEHIIEILKTIQNEGVKALKLTPQNALSYVSSAKVFAHRSRDPIAVLSDMKKCRGHEGCYVIDHGNGEVSVMNASEFKRMYEPAGGDLLHMYRRKTVVLARRMDKAYFVRYGNDVLRGDAGSYLVQQEDKLVTPSLVDQWVMPSDLFESTFEQIFIEKNTAL